MVNVIITAPKGSMGSLIVQEASKIEEINIIGCLGNPGREYIGMDAGLVCGLGREIGAIVYDDIEKIIDEAEVVVDFSTVEVGMTVLDSCIRHRKALIVGTTGFSAEQTAKILAAADEIPVMKAANTSFVVNVMNELLAQAAAKLGAKCTIEVIDYHSETKLDAPSGTALEMGEIMAEASPDKEADDIRYHSIRAGNTPSTHKVIFGCMGEKLEIHHDAYDWRCYASGACDAILFMAGKSKGSYQMSDVIK